MEKSFFFNMMKPIALLIAGITFSIHTTLLFIHLIHHRSLIESFSPHALFYFSTCVLVGLTVILSVMAFILGVKVLVLTCHQVLSSETREVRKN